MTRPDQLGDTQQAALDAILAASPELASVAASVRAFAVMMNERHRRRQLEPWMNDAHATGEPAAHNLSLRSVKRLLAAAGVRRTQSGA